MSYSKEVEIFYLKNKDEIVLSFEYNKIINNFSLTKTATYTITNIKIINKDLLPIEFQKKYGNEIINKPNLKKWLLSRRAPRSRKNINEIRKYQKILIDDEGNKNDILDYIKLSFGLSLNDSYWIVNKDKLDYKWEKYNLYNNRFDEVLALIAIGDKTIFNSQFVNKKSAIRLSPEYTTDGRLAKCWSIIDKEIYLLKKSSINHKKEAYVEFYMTQVLKVLDFSHIEYDIIKYNDNIVSKCKLFTDENIGFVPIYKCFKINNNLLQNEEKLIKKIINIFGEEHFYNLLLFDSLIGNIDRHLGNFGMLKDNNTGKLLCPFPIFDNGTSLMSLNYDNIDDFLLFEKSRFNFNFRVQGQLAVEKRHREKLIKLSKFKFEKHPLYNLEDKDLELAEKFIQDQSKFLLEKLDKKINLEKTIDKYIEEHKIEKLSNKDIQNINSKFTIEDLELVNIILRKKVAYTL